MFQKEKHIPVIHILQLILSGCSKMGIDWEHLVVSAHNIPFAYYILIYHIPLALIDNFNINLSSILTYPAILIFILTGNDLQLTCKFSGLLSFMLKCGACTTSVILRKCYCSYVCSLYLGEHCFHQVFFPLALKSATLFSYNLLLFYINS